MEKFPSLVPYDRATHHLPHFFQKTTDILGPARGMFRCALYSTSCTTWVPSKGPTRLLLHSNSSSTRGSAAGTQRMCRCGLLFKKILYVVFHIKTQKTNVNESWPPVESFNLSWAGGLQEAPRRASTPWRSSATATDNAPRSVPRSRLKLKDSERALILTLIIEKRVVKANGKEATTWREELGSRRVTQLTFSRRVIQILKSPSSNLDKMRVRHGHCGTVALCARTSWKSPIQIQSLIVALATCHASSTLACVAFKASWRRQASVGNILARKNLYRFPSRGSQGSWFGVLIRNLQDSVKFTEATGGTPVGTSLSKRATSCVAPSLRMLV